MRLDGKEFSLPTFYVDSASDLASAAEELSHCKRLGVDTESNSLFAFKERVCTIQISSTKANYIFDTIRLPDASALAGLFSDPKVEKVFQGADYDVGLLKRDFGFEVNNIFDTMVAAQFLNYERIGMADLVEHFFAVRLEKKFTKCDWAERPLSIEQMVYLCQDTLYLNGLRGYLHDELVKRDLIEEAEIEFHHLEKRPPLEPAYESMSVWDIKGARNLDMHEIPVMYELFVWRQKRAKKIDLPPFKVINNKTLIDLAKARPRNKQQLLEVNGITSTVWRRYGQYLLNSVGRGDKRPASKVPAPQVRRNDSRKPVHWDDQQLVDSLKKWRNAKAEELNIHHLAVMPGHVLEEVARIKPRDLVELEAIEGVGGKRARVYGEEVLKIIKEKSKSV
jgi:ribonuclease D